MPAGSQEGLELARSGAQSSEAQLAAALQQAVVLQLEASLEEVAPLNLVVEAELDPQGFRLSRE